MSGVPGGARRSSRTVTEYPSGSFDDWRDRARRPLVAGTPPDRLHWVDRWNEQTSLLDACARPRPSSIAARPPEASEYGQSGTSEAGAPTASGGRPPSVSRRFLTLARVVACHSDPIRWCLLYEAAWRLTHGESRLVDVATDPLVHRLLRMRKAVDRDVHKMRAFVRFHRMEDSDGERWISWFEPDHRIEERNARFFVDRFMSMNFSIFTPRASVHWDGEKCWIGEGARAADIRGTDALVDLWKTYYASTYNPARTRWNAMVAEMPVKYWKNLPEASLIPHLLRDADERVERMVSAPPSPSEHAQRKRKRAAVERRRRPSR